MARKETAKIKSRPGLFGTIIHYDEKGRKIGESRQGIFGATIHTDAKGKTVSGKLLFVLESERLNIKLHFNINDHPAPNGTEIKTLF